MRGDCEQAREVIPGLNAFWTNLHAQNLGFFGFEFGFSENAFFF